MLVILTTIKIRAISDFFVFSCLFHYPKAMLLVIFFRIAIRFNAHKIAHQHSRVKISQGLFFAALMKARYLFTRAGALRRSRGSRHWMLRCQQ